MKMPFGKFKGLDLSEIIKDHPGYIVWLKEECELNGELGTIVNKNYKKCFRQVVIDDHYNETQEDEYYDDYARGFNWDD